MNRPDRGVTLVELLIAVTILSMISVAAAALMSVCLKAHAYGTDRSALYREGRFLMEQMTNGVRNSTFVVTPGTAGSTLSFSGTVNEDADFYFGDALFPRVDEDLSGDMNNDGSPGIAGVDDDGDGSVDEGLKTNDDDEDGSQQEDPLNPVTYTFNSTPHALDVVLPGSATSNLLSTRVNAFTATYEAQDATHFPRVLISMTLAGTGGETVSFSEYVYPRNSAQYTGKRVR